MLHDYLVERGLRDASQISLVMPLGAPIPPSPAASQALLAVFAEPTRLSSGASRRALVRP
jgi:sulfide:quinone oxidoreductase